MPAPYSKSDDLEITTSMILESDTHPLERASLSSISITDNLGNNLSTLNVNDQLQIVGKVNNLQDFDQNFVFIFQITDDNNSIVSLSWVQGQLGSLQTLDVSQSWIPKKSGSYNIETFVWDPNFVPLGSKGPVILVLVN